MKRLERIAARLSRGCLDFFVKDLPVELKPWGDAMLAELPQARGIYAPISWAMGGSMVLSKALMRRWFNGKTQRAASTESGGGNSPSPWQRAALVALLLSFAMGLSPEFRQAMEASLESWSPLWSPQRAEQSSELLRAAEKLGDPASLAFVALNTPDPEKAERLAEKAVKGDPQLVWIWYPVIQSELIAPNPPVDVRGPAVAARIEQLEAWDPDNSIPYLLDAERARWKQAGIFNALSLPPAPHNAEEARREQKWRSAMEKAFAAPRYDSYFSREMQVQRAVLLKLKVDNPLKFVRGIYWHAAPIWFNTKQFSDLLLKEGDNALRQGDAAQASESYWQAAHFAERMRAQASTAWERFHASALQKDSYRKLSTMMAGAQQDADKARIDQTLAMLERERESLSTRKGFWELIYGPISAAGIAVSLAVMIAVVALALSLAGLGYMFARRRLRFPVPRMVDRMLSMAGRSAPFVLAASCLCLYFTYLPFAQIYAGYLNGTLPSQESERLRAFMQIRYFPDMILSFLGGEEGLRIWFWEATVAVLAAVLVALVWRWSRTMKQSASPLQAS